MLREKLVIKQGFQRKDYIKHEHIIMNNENLHNDFINIRY